MVIGKDEEFAIRLSKGETPVAWEFSKCCCIVGDISNFKFQTSKIEITTMNTLNNDNQLKSILLISNVAYDNNIETKEGELGNRDECQEHPKLARAHNLSRNLDCKTQIS